jgi:ribosome-associated toxin RatA of RatAB toxin-antitoxin module
MSQHVENSIKVKLPADKVWQVLNNYGAIEKFAPTIKSSSIVNGLETGLGAKRKCTFADGSSLIEEITQYQEGQGYIMEISEHTMPLKSMQAEMRVNAIDDENCEIFMSADFVVKGGPLGWLLGQFMLRPVMKGVFKKVMSGLAYHCATGQTVAEALPSNDELKKFITA